MVEIAKSDNCVLFIMTINAKKNSKFANNVVIFDKKVILHKNQLKKLGISYTMWKDA